VARRGGWRRIGRPKRFRYVDARGNEISDPNRRERIEALVIPPAWKDVWISPNPGAKLQATGVDAAGRTQYVYHPDYRAAREQAKFDRLVRFGELLPGLREHGRRDLRRGPYALAWACAVAVTLVNRAWFRIGSDRHARSSRTYGVTTLYKRHVEIRGDRLRFRFRTKNRALVRTTLVDRALASAVGDLLSLPGGSRLFRFERDGEFANLTATHLNDYIGEHLGETFTAKDFRTWGGTLRAATGLAEHGPPASESEAKRVLAAVMREVGRELGNTPAVARASYVSPAVIELYRSGITLGDFDGKKERRVSATRRGLTKDERALLALLRSWRARRERS
jgi:DNA topoisomerase-1